MITVGIALALVAISWTLGSWDRVKLVAIALGIMGLVWFKSNYMILFR
jgi:hypothetical protein